jgi:hypothetical protein
MFVPVSCLVCADALDISIGHCCLQIWLSSTKKKGHEEPTLIELLSCYDLES